MFAIETAHAQQRAQQRGVPRLIVDWLMDYGEQTFDGHGAVVRYFSNRSIRTMERNFGKAPLRRLSEFLRCYLVEDSGDGTVITVGKRHPGRHIRRH